MHDMVSGLFQFRILYFFPFRPAARFSIIIAGRAALDLFICRQFGCCAGYGPLCAIYFISLPLRIAPLFYWQCSRHPEFIPGSTIYYSLRALFASLAQELRRVTVIAPINSAAPAIPSGHSVSLPVRRAGGTAARRPGGIGRARPGQRVYAILIYLPAGQFYSIR